MWSGFVACHDQTTKIFITSITSINSYSGTIARKENCVLFFITLPTLCWFSMPEHINLAVQLIDVYIL